MLTRPGRLTAACCPWPPPRAARRVQRRRGAHGIRLGQRHLEPDGRPVDHDLDLEPPRRARRRPRRRLGGRRLPRRAHGVPLGGVGARGGHGHPATAPACGIDVEGQANGSNQTVFITTKAGGTAEVLTVGDGLLGRRGRGALGRHHRRTPRPPRRWWASTRRSPESDATELGSFTLRTILTDAFAQPDLAVLESDTGAATETEVDGQPAYVLGRQGGPRLWVAADGSGTAAALRRAEERAGSDLTFTDWGRATTFTEPPPDRVVEN